MPKLGFHLLAICALLFLTCLSSLCLLCSVSDLMSPVCRLHGPVTMLTPFSGGVYAAPHFRGRPDGSQRKACSFLLPVSFLLLFIIVRILAELVIFPSHSDLASWCQAAVLVKCWKIERSSC